MTKSSNYLAGVAVAAMLATPVAVQAEEASELAYIRGMGAAEGERALRSRGFAHVNSQRAGRSNISYWWDEGDDDCVRVNEYNGDVVSIIDASDQDCGHHTGGNAAAAVGVVAGAAILGALLSHRSNHHDDDNHYDNHSDERAFDDGYNAGLHSASYHNPDRSDAYSRGYAAGVQQRTDNLRHHSGRGGYHPNVRFSDLEHDRAAGAMSAMESRGFEQVDNFTSGNTRYSIQWNDDTNQCVQMTIANGRVDDIRDIRTHPRCR